MQEIFRKYPKHKDCIDLHLLPIINCSAKSAEGIFHPSHFPKSLQLPCSCQETITVVAEV